MNKYKINKNQARMLLQGKVLQMGAIKVAASESIKASLQIIENHNAYDVYDIVITDKYEFDIVKKQKN